MKLVLCVPTLVKPYRQTLESIEASLPALDRAGIEHFMVSEVGCPYISSARATMLRKALDAQADAIVFIDHDVSWAPGDLLKLVQTEGDFVFGTYRFKKEDEEYMGQVLADDRGFPQVREDGAIRAFCGPAGFLKITPRCVDVMMERYPELCYGKRHAPHFDFFNHGAHRWVWYGEDYAACRRWLDIGEDLWLVPDLDITHHGSDGAAYPGNFHRFLMRQPGGSEAQNGA